MNCMSTSRILAASALAILGFAFPAQATVTYHWSNGTTCGNTPTASFSPGGAAFQVSLCASTTTERGCGFTAVLQANLSGESNAFSITARALGTGYVDPTVNAPSFPIAVTLPALEVDLGATANPSGPPPAPVSAAPGSDQRLATYTFAPHTSATNASYILRLSSASEFSTDQGDVTCAKAANSGAALPVLTLTARPMLIFTSAATATFTVAAPDTFNVTATGNPNPTYSASGPLPTGVTLTSAGVLSGTPASGTAGTYPLTITASNGNASNGSQSFRLVVAKRSQTITFGGIAGQPFNASPFTITGTSASSGLPITFASVTTVVCTVSAAVVTFFAGGTCTITAIQTGNIDFNPAAPVTQSFTITAHPPAAPITLFSTTDVATYGGEVTLLASVIGNGQTGSVTFSVGTSNGPVVLPGCSAVRLVAGTARCTAPGAFQNQNPRQYLAAYSGDATNAPASASFAQSVALNTAVLTLAAFPLPPIVSGRTTTLSALVKMISPAGTVTFFDNGIPVTGCEQTAVSMLADATDSAIVTCTVTLPASPSGIKQYVATFFYPAGHVSGRVSEQANIDLRVTAQGPADYTDMWWAGVSENGWGMSVTQHGPIQFNVIFAYDSLGKSLWYVMPGGSFNAAGTVFSGPLYLPTSSPFSAYDKTQFVIGAPIGSASITYHDSNTATLAFTINGINGTKTIQRQIFAAETTGPNLRTNDLWWATFAEDGWGMNIAQQGRVLFPVWYTYDATGKATFFTAQNGNWRGTVWSGDVFSHSSSPWLGVAYNPSLFTATIVGTMSLDFSNASSATMTTTVNGITQVRHIERQPY